MTLKLRFCSVWSVYSLMFPWIEDLQMNWGLRKLSCQFGIRLGNQLFSSLSSNALFRGSTSIYHSHHTLRTFQNFLSVPVSLWGANFQCLFLNFLQCLQNKSHLSAIFCQRMMVLFTLFMVEILVTFLPRYFPFCKIDIRKPFVL